MNSCLYRLVAFATLFAVLQFEADLLAQCSQRIEISNITVDQKQSSAKFDLKVIAQTTYHGQLYRIDETNEVLIQSFSGSGERLFSFDNLQFGKDGFYRVVIEYAGEDKFLCKRRVKDIVVTDTP